ncbi:MAG: thermonuclease family protein [Candidatus Izemoplasma sp.]|nr:thermonuclease family protein [Candidatus Izemoplasma sp.]
MKKVVLMLLVVIGTLGLYGCETPEENQSNRWVTLPDLNDWTESDIKAELDRLDVNYEIVYADDQVEELVGIFMMYEDHSIGDIVNIEESVKVIVYPPYTDDWVELPDLTNATYEEIAPLFNGLNLPFTIHEISTTDQTLDNEVIGYVGDYQAGEMYDPISAIGIEVYDYVPPVTDTYFSVLDLDYNGPLLDSDFFNQSYMNPRGGAFDVTLRTCTDGDTGRFNYPQDIYDAINSSAKSVRFLNMDTEETYPGGEEEWGKPASVYTCSLLESAEKIAIQTDPGDGLLDTHGRLLGWIWIQLPGEEDYFLLNYMLVRQGLAQVKYEFGAGETLSYGEYTYNEWMHIAEDDAILNERGQWGNLLDYYWDYENDQPDYNRWN